MNPQVPGLESPKPDFPLDPGPILLFDGICKFCNASVDFILSHEADHAIHFAPLQGEFAQAALAKFGWNPASLHTVIFIDKGIAYSKSRAALAIAAHLRIPWKWIRIFSLIPAPARDLFYDFIAVRRYRWFGKLDACRMPTPQLRERFLD